jgi:alpha,alpha-trehalose phosphorylase
VPDATMLRLYVDDEPLFLPTARMREYSRILDMRAGTLTRDLVWSTPAGKHVRVRSRRLVSLEHRHLVAMTFEVTILDHPAPVTVSSLVVNRQDAHLLSEFQESGARDPRLATVLPGRVLSAQISELAGRQILLGYRAVNSGMTLGVGVDHVIESQSHCEVTGSASGDMSEVTVTAETLPGVPIRLTKYVAYQVSALPR